MRLLSRAVHLLRTFVHGPDVSEAWRRAQLRQEDTHGIDGPAWDWDRFRETTRANRVERLRRAQEHATRTGKEIPDDDHP